MTDRYFTRLAWSLCALTLLFLALSLSLIILGWSTPLSPEYASWQVQAVSLVGVIGAPILGGLIASRRPRNPYGWVWLVFGLGLTLQLLAESYAAYALVVEPGSLPAPRLISRLLELGGPMALALAPFLLLLFPTGRLPSRRWRLLAWFAAVSGAVLVVLNLLFENGPDRVGGAVSAVTIIVVLVIFVSIFLSALSLVVRYRRASGLERQQLKWFALATVPTAFYVVGQMLFLDLLLGETLWNLLDTMTRIGLYVGISVAILKHRLYDIDIIINRTLVYALLTASLVLVYVGSVVGLQAAFRTLTGQETQFAIVASTLVISVLFNPLHRRIQDFIDRLFYRRKYDAAKTLDAFSMKLRDETDLEELDKSLVSVVTETMQPAHVSVWLRPREDRVER